MVLLLFVVGDGLEGGEWCSGGVVFLLGGRVVFGGGEGRKEEQVEHKPPQLTTQKALMFVCFFRLPL